MKSLVIFVSSLLLTGFTVPKDARPENMSTEEIMRELRELKERIRGLEEELSKKDQEIQNLQLQSVKRQEVAGKIEVGKSEGNPVAAIQDHIDTSGLIEFGGARESVEKRDGTGESQSDLNLTTLELALGAKVNEWVNVSSTFLFEDVTFGDETDVNIDVATLTIGNTEKFPLYFAAGAMYVPFGAFHPSDCACFQAHGFLLSPNQRTRGSLCHSGESRNPVA